MSVVCFQTKLVSTICLPHKTENVRYDLQTSEKVTQPKTLTVKETLPNENKQMRPRQKDFLCPVAKMEDGWVGRSVQNLCLDLKFFAIAKNSSEPTRRWTTV